jgi:hypothetical protein
MNLSCSKIVSIREVSACPPIFINHLSSRSSHQKLSKISTEYRSNQKHFECSKKQYYYMSYKIEIPRTHPLILGDRMNLLLTEPNTNNLGQVKVSQQINAENYD